jgi:hypothetical protein
VGAVLAGWRCLGEACHRPSARGMGGVGRLERNHSPCIFSMYPFATIAAT